MGTLIPQKDEIQTGKKNVQKKISSQFFHNGCPKVLCSLDSVFGNKKAGYSISALNDLCQSHVPLSFLLFLTSYSMVIIHNQHNYTLLSP